MSAPWRASLAGRQPASSSAFFPRLSTRKRTEGTGSAESSEDWAMRNPRTDRDRRGSSWTPGPGCLPFYIPPPMPSPGRSMSLIPHRPRPQKQEQRQASMYLPTVHRPPPSAASQPAPAPTDAPLGRQSPERRIAANRLPERPGPGNRVPPSPPASQRAIVVAVYLAHLCRPGRSPT